MNPPYYEQTELEPQYSNDDLLENLYDDRQLLEPDSGETYDLDEELLEE